MFRVLFLLALGFSASASTLKLRSLSDVSIHEVKTSPSSPTVFLIFQKDCHACRKQVKDLRCIASQSKVVLVGMFSSEGDLRVEYKQFNSQWPGLFGGSDFKKKFNIKNDLTPQILIVQNEKRHLITGLTPCKKISAYINKKENI